jgi:hypothetical protein
VYCALIPTVATQSYSYHRRVEDNLRSTIRAAKPTATSAKRKHPAAQEGLEDDDEPTPRLKPERKTEFETRPSGRRLNDIAMAPPTLTKTPRLRGGKALRDNDSDDDGGEAGRNGNIVSKAQKRQMEEERERVIKRYREMKERKRAQLKADGKSHMALSEREDSE